MSEQLLTEDLEETPEIEIKDEPTPVIEEKIELKEEDKEEDKDEEETIEFPTKKTIEKFAPGIFKKFPGLEASYYRDKQFTEHYATPADAKEAKEKSELLDEMQEDLYNGSSSKFLSKLKEENESAFKQVVDGYLDSLKNVDKDAYFNVVSNMYKTLSLHMLSDGKKNNNKNLEIAATIINNYLFGDPEAKPPVPFGDKKDQDSGVKSEREQLAQERLDAAQEDVSDRVEQSLKATIEDYIDPKESMSPYVRKMAVREALEQIQEELSNDRELSSVRDKLWIASSKERYSRESKENIKKAIMGRAKALLPKVLNRVRTEALKGDNGKKEERDRKGPVPAGRSRSSTASNNSGQQNGKQLPAGTNSLKFLMED